MPLQNPDDALLVRFLNIPVKNEAKSTEAGRPIYDDRDTCEIRRPGARDFGHYPATAVSHWETDPLSGEQRKITYAERFPKQFAQYKAGQAQTKAGTPLEEAKFLTEARRAELRALNILTVEALSTLDGQELKNLGPGGRELKNAAMEYIENSKSNASTLQLEAELKALRARNAILEEDAALRKDKSEFDGMSDEDLRAFIKERTGHAPHGAMGRKSLLRMATEAREEKVA